MSTSHDDPLSPEEQALASRLRGLGGPDGPASALDARILAAARQSVAKPVAPRRRWPVWSTVPGGAITALGTAAAFVLAVGVVWQTLPPNRPLPAPEPEAADGGFVPVEVIDAPVRSAARAAVADATASRTKQVTAAQPAVADRRQPLPAGDAPADARAAIAPPAPAIPASAAAGAQAPPTPEPAPARDAPPPQQAVAAAAAETAAGQRSALADSATPAAQPQPGAAVRRPTYTTTARARPEPRTPASHRSRPPARDASTTAPVTQAGPASAADARLPPDLWLDRIREHRARGETEAAIDSLRRFREQHPDTALPADLRDLAQ